MNKKAVLNVLYNVQHYIRKAENEVHEVIPKGQHFELTEADLDEIRCVVCNIIQDDFSVLMNWLARVNVIEPAKEN